MTDQEIHDLVYANDCYRIRSLPLEGKSVLDLGAHHGWFTRLAAECGADVWAFEASQANFAKLQENLAEGWMSSFRNRIQTFRCAVIGGDKTDSVKLNLKAEESCGHSLVWRGAGYQDADGQPNWEPVWGVPLDTILCMLNHVDLCKMDIEGAEYEVLSNSEQLDRIDRLIVEWHPVEMSKYQHMLAGLESELGFKEKWRDESIPRVVTTCLARKDVRYWQDGQEVTR